MILKFLKKHKKIIVPFALLFVFFTLITFIYYSGIGKIYFQQDEYYRTGKTIYYIYHDFGALWLKRFGFHYYPLQNLFYIGQYFIFKMDASLYMYLSLILQGLVGVFVYIFMKKIFSSRWFAFLLTFLFLINPGSYQVVLNEMVSTSYKIPVILMLSMFIILHGEIRKKGTFPLPKIKLLAILYLIAVAFFEGALIMIILVPAFFILFKSKYMYFEFNKTNILILSALFILTIVRLVLQSILPVDAPLPIEGSFIVSTFYNAGTTPFKFLAEYLLNTDNIFQMGRIYEQKIFPLKNRIDIDHGLISVTTGYEMVVAYFSAGFAILSVVILAIADKNSEKVKKYIKIIYFAIVWLVINAIVISPQGRLFNTLEPRYLYISGIGILMILGSLAGILWETFRKKRILRILLTIVIGVYFIWWALFSFVSIQRVQSALIKVSEARSSFIKQFRAFYPQLPDKAVIYIYCTDDCTSNATLGLPPEWVVPFQNGLGWVLLIIYSGDNPEKYAPYFSNYLFWDNKDKGYREIGDTSFGFFTDFEELSKTMRKYSLVPEDIIILQYESKKFKLTKVTDNNKIFNSLMRK